jgi:hypothetical protein
MNTGVHIDNLWSLDRHGAGHGDLHSEAASRWGQMNFETPLANMENAVYVASSSTEAEHYVDDRDLTWLGANSDPSLHLNKLPFVLGPIFSDRGKGLTYILVRVDVILTRETQTVPRLERSSAARSM